MLYQPKDGWNISSIYSFPVACERQYSLQYDNFTQVLIDAVEKKIADPDDYAIPQTLEFTVGANKVSYSPTPSSWYNGDVRIEVKITEPDNHTLIETVDQDLFTCTLTLLLLQKRTPLFLQPIFTDRGGETEFAQRRFKQLRFA